MQPRVSTRIGSSTAAVVVALVVVALLAFGAGATISGGPGRGSSPTPAASDGGATASGAPSRTAVPTASAPAGISAAGKVVPIRSAVIAPQVPGRVEAVAVAPGDRVTSGQTLVRLDGRRPRAAVAEAETDLDRALAGQERARAQRALLGPEATEAEIRAADADVSYAAAQVDAARAALANARIALNQTQITAPFAGSVVSVEVEEGEHAPMGASLVVLADISSWRIETSDLTELEVVQVAEGDPVTIRLPALPSAPLAGVVERIHVRGLDDQGRVTFAAVIRPDRHDPRLRWNMNAAVLFERVR